MAYNRFAKSPAVRWVPAPKTFTDVLEAVRFLLLRQRAYKITITELDGKDST